MKFSLIAIQTEKEGLIDGYWITNCNGINLDQARERADLNEYANSNRIKIAVVEQVPHTNPMLSYFKELKRLA